MPKPLTPERLRQLLHYESETGKWTRLVMMGRFPAGSKVGTARKSDGGRVRIMIDGCLYWASRLSFLYMKGRWPHNDGEHRDRDPSNNKWSNIRDATRSQNIINQGIRTDNTSGYKGVSWFRRRSCWHARINGKHLGYFKSKIAAAKAYDAAALNYYGEFAYLNFPHTKKTVPLRHRPTHAHREVHVQ